MGGLDHGHVQMHFRKSVGEFVRMRQKIAGAERHHNELVSHLPSGSLEKSTLIQKIKGSPFHRVIFTFCVKLFISSLKKMPQRILWTLKTVSCAANVGSKTETETDGGRWMPRSPRHLRLRVNRSGSTSHNGDLPPFRRISRYGGRPALSVCAPARACINSL